MRLDWTVNVFCNRFIHIVFVDKKKTTYTKFISLKVLLLVDMASSSSQRKPFRIAIIGGGIAGLFAALSIHHHCCRHATTNGDNNNNNHIQPDIDIDIDIDVYEQAAEYKEIGAGLGLAVNAAKLLDRIGLFDDARAIAGFRNNVWISFRRYDDSSEICTVPLKDETARRMQLSVHRAEFLEILVRAIRDRKAATLHTNKKCVGLEVCICTPYTLYCCLMMIDCV